MRSMASILQEILKFSPQEIRRQREEIEREQERLRTSLRELRELCEHRNKVHCTDALCDCAWHCSDCGASF